MKPSIQRAVFAASVTLMALAAAGTVKADGTWRGLTVAPYDRDDYPYSQVVRDAHHRWHRRPDVQAVLAAASPAGGRLIY